MSVTASGPRGDRADVELRIPADGAYVSVLRITAAGLAARLDFTIDDVEDLRIAVGEATAMVLPEAGPGADVTCRFWLMPSEITVSVSVEPTEASPVGPDPDSFAWQVLTTLASTASVDSGQGRFGVTMTMNAMDLAADMSAGH